MDEQRQGRDVGSVFGTDGVRGVANTEVTPELALRLGQAVVTVLQDEGTSRPGVLVGRDPRWSGEMLEAALVAGITSAGGDAVCLGVLPTPGVAHLTATGQAGAGIMVSASHNPVPDNGLKVFGHDGFKLTDDEEARLEALLEGAARPHRPTGTDVGRRHDDPGAVSRYVRAVVEAGDVDLAGMHVVVDGANGAAALVGPQVLRALGAQVTVVGGTPDGATINAGVGSTHPEVVAEEVVRVGADVGLSLDGDADRLIAADADGALVDGDTILAILAREAHQQGRLANGTVVTTVMTNLGFHHAMRGLGIDVVSTKVGDRYVLEAMRRDGHLLGGEQSGHLIQLDQTTTGDGLRSGVSLLRAVAAAGTSLGELAGVMQRLPQVLVNVAGVDRAGLASSDEVRGAIAAVEADLGDGGRVLVRPSGTEPLVRVMVEAPTHEDAEAAAERIVVAVRSDLALAG